MTQGRKLRRIDSPQAAQQSPKSQPILYKVELMDRRRLWPQAELLKALVVRDAPSAGRNLRKDADMFAEQLLATYLSDAPGGFWRDAFDIRGAFIAKENPGSSLYHLWTAIPEIDHLTGLSRVS